MTIVEEILQIVPGLTPEEQRHVLDVATRLRDARGLPDITLPPTGASPAEWDAWRARLRDRGERVLGAEKQRLQALGLIDARWTPLTEELPEDR